MIGIMYVHTHMHKHPIGDYYIMQMYGWKHSDMVYAVQWNLSLWDQIFLATFCCQYRGFPLSEVNGGSFCDQNFCPYYGVLSP